MRLRGAPGSLRARTFQVIAVPTGIVTAELTRLPRGEEPDTVVCSTCGTREADAEARFCRRCGTALDGGP